MKNIIYIYAIIAGLLLFSSCNKWLDLKPQDGIVRENFWKTKEDVDVAVNGIYASLLEDNLIYSLFSWGELRADMVTSTSRTTIDELNLMSGNMLPSNSLSFWGNVYFTINLCNTVIEYAPLVLESDPTFNEDALQAYSAEAHAVRALMYFYLYRSFGEVPLIVRPTDKDDAIVRIGKNSKEEIYSQIVSDLEFAEKNALQTYGSQAQDKGRMTKYGVYALMADVYLWEDQYDKALTACNMIVESNRFGLINSPGFGQSQWFNTLFFNGNSNESIFEFQFHKNKLNPFDILFANSNRRFVASERVMDQFYGVDIDDEDNYDWRANGASLRSSDGVIWKFSGATGGQRDLALRLPEDSYAHWFVYRYSDILLMKAEALTWLNRGEEALELVYHVRERAQALEFSDLMPSADSPSDVAKFILDERAREFAFEGKRWFDVLRFVKRNNYAELNELLDVVVENVPPNTVNSVRNKFRDPNSHYLPVFADEFERDPNMVQNPFYK